VLFTKAVSCLTGPNDPVMIPKGSLKTDWEVELGVVIGSRARYVDEASALDYVAGYVLINDVSERAFQIERGGTWDKGKGCDTFGPVGPWMVTSDEVGDPQDLGHVAGRQRPAQAGRLVQDHDLPDQQAGLVHQRVHDA
jgi:2,4-diketo-3-deoxy-L-fuconate hydrolase